MADEEIEVEAVMVLRKALKMRTVMGQIFQGKMDVYECPKPYVLILNISTEHEHSVRMDVHKQDLSREMRLWLEGKQIHNPLVVVPQRIEDAMTRFVKFGKAPLQEELILWIASRSELVWAPEAECMFGGFPVPDPEDIAREAREAAAKEQAIRDARDFGGTRLNMAFEQTAGSAQDSRAYQDDAMRLRDSKYANNGDLREAVHGPDLDRKAISTDKHDPLMYDRVSGTHDYTAKQMAQLRQSREARGPANTHLLARELLGKSHALSSLKAHKTKGREGSKLSVVTPQLSGEHYRLGCEIERARKDVTEAMDRRRRMIEIAKTRQKHSADHYREIRAKSKADTTGWVRSANEELIALHKIQGDIEDDVRKQKNLVARAQQRVMRTMAPPGNASRAGKSQPGVLIGPGPLPPEALYTQENPILERAAKNHYWDCHGRRHGRPNTAEFDDSDTSEIIHHALEALRKAGKTLSAHKLDLKAVFDEFDASGDGFLSVEEMASALLSLDVRLNTASLMALFRHFDPNGSGSVHYGEFLWGFFNRRELARQWRRSTSRMQLKEIRFKFNEADKSGDGRLSKREFKKFLKSFAIEATEHELEVMMFRFDVDGDGELDLNEFQAFLENELTVLQNADALKGDISPILAQSRRAVDRSMGKDRKHGIHDVASPRSGSGSPSPRPRPLSQAGSVRSHRKSCKCSQFVHHGACIHVDPGMASAADEGKVSEVDATFVSGALRKQAAVETLLGGRVFNKTQPA